MNMLDEHKYIEELQRERIFNKNNATSSVKRPIEEAPKVDVYRVNNTGGKWIYESNRSIIEAFAKQNNISISEIQALRVCEYK